MKCLICGAADLTAYEDEIGMDIDDVLGVCEPCLADAALGRAVRRMPEGTALFHSRRNSSLEGQWLLSRESPSNLRGKIDGRGNGVEAALKAARLMEGEEK